MTEKKESKSALTISKADSYKELRVVLSSFGIDAKREKEFNSGKKIEVTKEELNKIGKKRWLQNT